MTASRVLEDALSVLLGASCAGCDAPGRMLCDDCRSALAAAPVTRELAGGLAVTAALRFDGVAARCLRAVKEEGMTMLVRPLAASLEGLLPRDALIVPLPTSATAFRRRGFRVPELLVAAAGRRPERMLAAVGRRADQRGLGRAERARNVRGSLRATRPGRGREVVIFDDVITTGATISEASEVLERAGFRVAAAVALAATIRRGEL